MYTSVDGESRPLDEAFAATRVVADVRPGAAMDALCPDVSYEHTQRNSTRHGVPWRARSLRLAKGFEQVLHGKALGGGCVAGVCCSWILFNTFDGTAAGSCLKPPGGIDMPGIPIGEGAMLALGTVGNRTAAMAVGEGYEVFMGPEYLECSEPWGEPGRSTGIRGCGGACCSDDAPC